MRIGILYSGGKDSTQTLWYYLEQGWDVSCLLAVLPKNPDSWMFQQPSRALLEAQARSLGVPLLIQESAGEKEEELADLKDLLARAKAEYGIEGVAAGAVASEYQHERISRVCHEVNLRTFTPLWHKDHATLLRELIAAGFDVRMTRVAADGLSSSWLGRELTGDDVDALERLQRTHGVHPGGEGGEYETIVLDGPIFHGPIAISSDTIVESEHRGELRITAVHRSS